ncbi:MAG: hypothetical protein JXA13_05040 [Anaerolineales bacterium]|nr:hypothetical protein [Anaerolineales bacterium]
MPHTLLLHISGEEAIIGEVDELPAPSDNMIRINNPRRRDGKDLHYIQNDVVAAIWPLEKINFIEILPGDEDDQIIGFVRE